MQQEIFVFDTFWMLNVKYAVVLFILAAHNMSVKAKKNLERSQILAKYPNQSYKNTVVTQTKTTVHLLKHPIHKAQTLVL